MLNDINIEIEDEVKVFTINPMHIVFASIPKHRKFIPYLDMFNEIKHYTKWCCFNSDIKKFADFKSKSAR